MKLLTTVILAAAGQDYDFYASGESYRFGSVGDFSHTAGSATTQEDGFVAGINSDATASDDNAANDSQFSHLTGIYADNVRYLTFGHGGNRRFCHTTRNNRAVYNWTSHKYGGYFAEGRNFMECMGEELYCFIEERAHYGQIIGISAGCEQMMNHPSVTIQDQQALISGTYTQINAIKNNYNQEAARGGANRHGFFTYYGMGGCLAMPAQNGHHYTYDRKRFATGRGTVTEEGLSPQNRDMLTYPDSHRIGVDSPSWRSYKWLNYYRNYHGGYGQNQCLRFPKQRLEDPLQATLTGASPVPTTFDPNNTSGDAQKCSTGGAEGGWTVTPEATRTDCTRRVHAGHTYTSPGQLLPFGVSVCRACCVAEFYRGGDFASAGVLTDYAHDMLCNYPPDSDSVINDMTNEQFEELIPRFDMSGPAFNAFQTPNEPTKTMNPNNDNNLFVHGSWCDEPGPARGCARVPNEQWGTTDGGSTAELATDFYLWGANFANNVNVSKKEFRYTCDNRNLVDITPSPVLGGVSPITSATNRDWCPGRPWLAKTYDDARHTKPILATSFATTNTHNIVG